MWSHSQLKGFRFSESNDGSRAVFRLPLHRNLIRGQSCNWNRDELERILITIGFGNPVKSCNTSFVILGLSELFWTLMDWSLPRLQSVELDHWTWEEISDLWTFVWWRSLQSERAALLRLRVVGATRTANARGIGTVAGGARGSTTSAHWSWSAATRGRTRSKTHWTILHSPHYHRLFCWWWRQLPVSSPLPLLHCPMASSKLDSFSILYELKLTCG